MTKATTIHKWLAFILMAVGTAFTGLLFGLGLGWLLSRVFSGDFAGWGGLVGAIMGIALGYPVGVIVGQIITYKLLHYRGSLWLGALGAVLGVALVFGLAAPLNLNLNPNLLQGAFLGLTPLLATAGYHLRRGRS
jgi:hypothetical protein